MNKWMLIAVLLVIVIAGLALVLPKPTTNNPPPVPTTEQSPAPSEQAQTPGEEKCQALTVSSPKENEKINSPLEVKAIVDNRNPQCRWTVFEAQAGIIELRDNQGAILGQGTLTTTQDWMVTTPVEYNGEITFTKPQSGDAKLVIIEENPSGKPNPKTLTLPLSF